VFCLVSLYMIIGEDLRGHLTNLSSSKVGIEIFSKSSNKIKLELLIFFSR
jgi:hypothetical protein